MKIYRFHPWNVTPREAIHIQERLRAKVIPRGKVTRPRFVAGADLAFEKDSDGAVACVVLLTFPGMDVVETVLLRAQPSFPYVPGLLSFREAPPLLRAFEKLRHTPDVVFIDGHGLSHPRAAGLACHIGVCLDCPVIGCAKSVLVGTYAEPAPSRGAVSYLYNGQGRVLGAVVRTRDRVRPVYVSVGHRISLAEAIRLTLRCSSGFRIPEPTRQADLRAGAAKRKRLVGRASPSRSFGGSAHRRGSYGARAAETRVKAEGVRGKS